MRFAAVMYEAPKDIEDFYLREEDRVRSLARKFGIAVHDRDDFWMDIVAKVHRKKIIERFDPARNVRWSTYIFTVVKNHASNFLKRSSRDPMDQAIRIVDADVYDAGGSKSNIKSLDQVSFQSQTQNKGFEHAERNILLSQFEKFLNGKTLNRGERFEYDVLQFNRGMEEEYRVEDRKSLGAMFRMIRSGKQQKEIAHAMGVAESSVVNYKRRIQDYAKLMGYSDESVDQR